MGHGRPVRRSNQLHPLDTLLNAAANASPRLEGRSPDDVKPEAAAIPETKTEATLSGMAVLVGSVLDGIPENAAIGMGLASENGPKLGLVLLGAVFLSNLPAAIASSSGMRKGRSFSCLHRDSVDPRYSRLHGVMRHRIPFSWQSS